MMSRQPAPNAQEGTRVDDRQHTDVYIYIYIISIRDQIVKGFGVGKILTITQLFFAIDFLTEHRMTNNRSFVNGGWVEK
jgi:hypothetical protein